MKKIGTIQNKIVVIQDQNIGMNSFRFGDNIMEYFMFSRSFSHDAELTPLALYNDIRKKQQTSSSKLMIPLDLEKDNIAWIAGGSDDMSAYTKAYAEIKSK